MILAAFDSITTQWYRWPNRSWTIIRSHLNAVTFRQILPKPRSVTTIPLIIPEHWTADLLRTRTTFKWIHRFAFAYFKHVPISIRQTTLRFADSVDSTIPNNFIFNVMNAARLTIIHEKKRNITTQKWYGRNEKRQSARSRRKILTQARGWDRLTINRINMTYGTARRRVGESCKWDLNWMESVYRPYVDRSRSFDERGRRGTIRKGKLKWWRRRVIAGLYCFLPGSHPVCLGFWSDITKYTYTRPQ